jgi:hypothetical protein
VVLQWQPHRRDCFKAVAVDDQATLEDSKANWQSELRKLNVECVWISLMNALKMWISSEFNEKKMEKSENPSRTSSQKVNNDQ